jgi:hypothetical protein
MYDEITLENKDTKWGILGVILLGITVIFLFIFSLLILPGVLK